MICVNSVSIYPNALTLKAGETYCEATVQICPTNATNQTVIWKTNNPCVATVNPSGHITAVAAGAAIITAESSDGCGIYDTCTITVIEAIPVTSVEITDYDTIMKEGSSAYFAATVSPDNATNKNVVWTSSNEDVATVHPQSGLVYAKNSGTVSIIAAAADDCNISDCITITVTDVIKTDTITMNSTSKCLEEGDSFQLTVSICPTNVTNTNVSWYSSDTNVATVCNGKVYAVSKGSAVITAAATDGSRVFAECAVTVTDGVLVKNVSVSPSSAELFVEESMYLTEEACPPNATNKCVYWESSNPEIASVAPPSGLVIAHSVGTARIYAKTTDGSDKFAYCTVTVKPIEIESIALENVELPMGTYASITRTILPKNATNQNLRWCCSNENIVEVDEETGCIYGKSEGTTSIYAFAQDGSEQGAYCTVTVRAPISIETFEIKNRLRAVVKGNKMSLTLHISPSNAYAENIRWESSNNDIAIIDNDGVITGLEYGSVTITATELYSGRHASILIYVVQEYVVVEKDGNFFNKITFMNTGDVWLGINHDMINDLNNFMNETLKERLYDNMYERHYTNQDGFNVFENPKTYTIEQMRLIYSIDPYGFAIYIKEYANNVYAKQKSADVDNEENDSSLANVVEYKDYIFNQLFKTSPDYYYRVAPNIWRKINRQQTSINLLTHMSESELLFGTHNIWDEFTIIELTQMTLDIIVTALGFSGSLPAKIIKLFISTLNTIISVGQSIEHETILEYAADEIKGKLLEETFQWAYEIFDMGNTFAGVAETIASRPYFANLMHYTAASTNYGVLVRLDDGVLYNVDSFTQN